MPQANRNTLVAVVFDDPYKAEEARAALHRMGGEGLLETFPFIMAGTLGGWLVGKLTDHGITSSFIGKVKKEVGPREVGPHRVRALG